MPNYFSNLPVELIYKILDDITIFDILGSLCLVNKQLHFICLGYPRFRVDLSCIRKNKQFDIVCDQLASISSQIVSLSISNRNDAAIPSKIERFFLRFEFINDTFSNLKSLHLSHLNLIMWKSIRNHIKSLVSLFINIVYMRLIDDACTFTSYLIKDILFMPISLKHLSVRSNNDSVSISLSAICEEQVSSIEHLSLLNIYIDFQQLYCLAPTLRTLHTNVNTHYPQHEFRSIPFENLSRLSVNIHHMYFSTIEQLLHPMIKLAHLLIVASGVYHDMSDGTEWERILAKITSFKFLFTFHKSTWVEEPIKLDSFLSLFWLKKKQWHVGYDRCTISGFSLLYSIPYLGNSYPWCSIKGPIDTESTGPRVLSLNNVNCLTVNERLPTDSKCLRRLINLQNLVISENDISFHVLFHDILPYIDISRITTLFIFYNRSKIDINTFVRFVSNMPHLRSLGAPIGFLKFLFVSHWPNIRRLKIVLSWPIATITESGLTPNEIDAFYRSFTHIEYLSVDQDFNLNLSILLNNIPKTISNIVIYQPINITQAEFPEFITCDWLEQNTRLRNFLYSCNELNAVSLWL